MPSSSKAVLVIPNKEEQEKKKEKKKDKGGSSPSNNDVVVDIIFAHFDAYQHERKSNVGSSATAGKNNATQAAARAAAASLRRDLVAQSLSSSSITINNNNNNASEEEGQQVAISIVQCLDSAMSSIAGAPSSSSSTSLIEGWMESITSVWELAAAVALDAPNHHHRAHNNNNNNDNKKKDEEQMLMEHVARATIQRAVEYATLAEKDVVRIQGCQLLGLCVRHLAMKSSSSSGDGANGNNKTILKKGGGKKKGTTGTTVAPSSSVSWVPSTQHSTATATLTSWEVECLLSVGKALLSRITDKIAKVRHAAIVACAPLLPIMTSFSTATTTVVRDTIQSILLKLLWIMSNDTSAANRAAVVQVLPPLPSSTCVEQDEEEEENNNSMLWLLQPIIERIKDVDVKVRESALNYLREKVIFGTHLTEDQRVEILRTGLTKR